MEKLKMQTTNVVDENIKRIGEMFPNCLTEVKDEKGRPQVAIDFDQLRQELSKNIVEGPEERYQFTWPDKRNAIRLAKGVARGQVADISDYYHLGLKIGEGIQE